MSTAVDSKTKNDKSFHIGIPEILLILGVITILIAPILFTRESIFNSFDFHDSGQIGDTIGGITSPFLSLIGSVLVYLALKAQIEANKIVMTQFQTLQEQSILDKKKEAIYKRIDVIRDDLKSFLHHEKITKGGTSVRNDYVGIDAINMFFNFIYREERCDGNYEDIFMNSKHLQLEIIMSLLESLFHRIENEKFDQEDKSSMKYYLLYQYGTYLKPVFESHKDARSKNESLCKECNRYHKGISEKLFNYYDRIEAASG